MEYLYKVYRKYNLSEYKREVEKEAMRQVRLTSISISGSKIKKSQPGNFSVGSIILFVISSFGTRLIICRACHRQSRWIDR